jgi:hypothetical protein
MPQGPTTPLSSRRALAHRSTSCSPQFPLCASPPCVPRRLWGGGPKTPHNRFMVRSQGEALSLQTTCVGQAPRQTSHPPPPLPPQTCTCFVMRARSSLSVPPVLHCDNVCVCVCGPRRLGWKRKTFSCPVSWHSPLLRTPCQPAWSSRCDRRWWPSVACKASSPPSRKRCASAGVPSKPQGLGGRVCRLAVCTQPHLWFASPC